MFFLKINKNLLITATILIVLIAAILLFKPGMRDIQLSAEEALQQTVKRNHLLSVNRYKRLLQSDEQVILIDLRKFSDYESGHLPDAVSIPLDEILDKKNIRLFKEKEAIKVMYSDSSYKAAQAWMVLYQIGCREIAILETTGSLEELIANWQDADEQLIYKDERKQFTFVPDTTVKADLPD